MQFMTLPHKTPLIDACLLSKVCELREKMTRLEMDLTHALEMNNKAVEERLRLQERRQELLARLRETLRRMVTVEKQLRSVSASTLSVSSSSSLGSLSTSSKGSLSSLSFTDIYSSDLCGGDLYSGRSGIPQPPLEASGVAELQRRVERLLRSNSESDRLYAEKLRDLEGGGGGGSGGSQDASSAPGRVLSPSVLSLSPRSSLSSLSPPGDASHLDDSDLAQVQERLAGLAPGPPVDEEEEEDPPITHSMSAAVSDESVAGDSGVYEACPKGGSNSPEALETPQVRIKLR